MAAIARTTTVPTICGWGGQHGGGTHPQQPRPEQRATQALTLCQYHDKWGELACKCTASCSRWLSDKPCRHIVFFMLNRRRNNASIQKTKRSVAKRSHDSTEASKTGGKLKTRFPRRFAYSTLDPFGQKPRINQFLIPHIRLN